MISSRLFPKLMSRTVLFTAAIGVSSCASANGISGPVDAVLLNPQDAPTRQAIRVFVRENSGAGLIANPDSLAKSPALSNTQRKLERGLNTRDAFTPHGDYRLIMDENNRCWLTHRLQDVVSQVELPSSASCAAYRAS